MKNKIVRRILAFLKDYTKCVSKNFFTLSGFVAWICSLILFVYHLTNINTLDKDILYIISILFTCGFMLLTLTNWGLDSLSCYRGAVEHIKRHGQIDRRFLQKYDKSYCHSIGLRLAAKEADVKIE